MNLKKGDHRPGSSLVQQVEQAILRHQLIRDGERLVVAVSGGLDSMVLLHLLHELTPSHRWSLAVAHLNHQLRGRSSLTDAALVRKTARRLKLKCAVACGNVRLAAQRHKLSIEMAARRVRHEFLARTATRVGATKVVLAHHADDQLELFFLRLFRGAGSEGLAGMNWSNPAPGTPGITLIRPLLGVSKTDLEEYARRRGIAFREDATNADVEIPRNRIRHELLPLLRKHFQPQFNQILPRTMDILGAESDYLVQTARDWLKASSTQFSALPIAVQRRVIQLQLLERGVVPEYEQVETLRLHPETVLEVRVGLPPRGRVSGKKSLRLTVDESGRLMETAPAVAEFTGSRVQIRLLPDAKGIPVSIKGHVEFGGVDIRWKLSGTAGASRLKALSCSEMFDADRVGRGVILRHWQPGDRFQPIGMKGSVKLQDYFVNSKVPREERHCRVLAVSESGEVFWVEGLRISERFKLTAETTRSLQWSWKRL